MVIFNISLTTYINIQRGLLWGMEFLALSDQIIWRLWTCCWQKSYERPQRTSNMGSTTIDHPEFCVLLLGIVIGIALLKAAGKHRGSHMISFTSPLIWSCIINRDIFSITASIVWARCRTSIPWPCASLRAAQSCGCTCTWCITVAAGHRCWEEKLQCKRWRTSPSARLNRGYASPSIGGSW